MRWRRQLAEAHYSLGDLHAQGVCVREALALAGEPAPNSRAQVCLRLLRCSIQLAIQQVFPPKTISKKNNMLGSWEQELTRCLSQAAIGDYFQLRFSRSFCHIIAAAVHGERTGTSAEMALSSAQLACGLGLLGYSRLAKHFMTRAERSVSALGVRPFILNCASLMRCGASAAVIGHLSISGYIRPRNCVLQLGTN